MSERTSFRQLQNGSGTAQTEPVSLVCGTSVIKYLVKGKKRMYTICERKGWGKCERNNIKFNELRGGGVAPSLEQKFLCSSWKTILEQMLTLLPTESQCQSRSRNHSPWQSHTAELFFWRSQPIEKLPTLEQFLKDLVPCWIMLEHVGKKWKRWTVMYWPKFLIPILLYFLQCGESLKNKLSMGRKIVEVKKYFILFQFLTLSYFYPTVFNQQRIKLIFLSFS